MLKKSSQKYVAAIVFLLVLILGIWFFKKDVNLIWYWIFGLSFGVIFQRSRLCFVSAASEPLITGSTAQFRAILIGILIASLGISSLKYLSNGMLDMLGVSTVGLPLIVGAFLFGVGMILSGCCTLGIFVRMAEGYTIHIITLICTVAGYLIANTHYHSVWAPFIVDAPVIFLPSELGWTFGVVAHIVVIVLLYLVALRHEQNSASSYSGSYLKGAIFLGIFTIMHYIILKSGFSVTGAFFYFSEFSKGFPSTAIGPNLRNLGIFTGALFSVFACAEFKFKKIRSLKQVCVTGVGGLFMGYGATIAGGCNISAFFNAAASLSLSAWVFMICLFLGTLVGTKLLYKLL